MNEITTKETTALAHSDQMDFSFGMENMIASDIKLPKIMLMQAMSEMLKNDAIGARAGEIREGVEGRLFAKKGQAVQIIPFYFSNHWLVQKEVNGKMEFYKIEDRLGTEPNRDYEEVIEGVRYTNDKLLNIFCMVRGEDGAIPYQLGLRRSSFTNAGKSFIQKISLLRAQKKAPANIVWNLSTKEVENDKGTWFAFTLEAAKDEAGKDISTTVEELAQAYEHYKNITAHLKTGAIDLNKQEATGESPDVA
jgi:hypothetical protein